MNIQNNSFEQNRLSKTGVLFNNHLAKNLKRRLIPRFFWARLMLYLCIIQTICMVTLILYAVIIAQEEIIYRLTFLVANIFSLIICWDAVTHKNMIQAISFIIFNGFCLSFVALQYSTSKDGINKGILIAIIIAESCCFISYIALTWEIYREYGWKIYKKLGADEKIHKMYKHYQMLIVFMEMELFLSLAIAVQFGTNHNAEKWETLIQIAFVIPASVLILGFAFYALIKENRVIMILVIICHFATFGYFIFQLTNIIKPHLNKDLFNPYKDIWKYLTFSLVFMIVLNIITLICLIRCYLDFGKGLLETILRQRELDNHLQPKLDNENSLEDGIVNPRARWELD